MELAADLRPRRRALRLQGAMAPMLECLAVLAAIVAWLPAFDDVTAFGEGRDGRYADAGFRVDGLPEPVLPAMCRGAASFADPSVRDSLCQSAPVAETPTSRQLFSRTLAQAASGAARAFNAPLIDARLQLEALRLQQREGLGDLRDVAGAMAAIESDLRPYIERFRLDPAGERAPQPMVCALQWAQAAIGTTGNDTARANAVLLLAAALDGRRATAWLAAQATLPAVPRAAPPCDAGGTEALSATAALMEDARQSRSHARKNEAMRALLATAGWQWAGAMLLGFVFVVWARHASSPLIGVAAALGAWTIAAWLARVPWPLVDARAFEPARQEAALGSAPAGFVLVLGAAALVLLAWAMARRGANRARLCAAQTMSSRIGYAGFVLATGLGWLLLLDLSAHGHPVNRYLALYHHGHLWLGMTVFSVLVCLRRPISRVLAEGLSLAGELQRHVARRLGMVAAPALVLTSAAAVLALGLGLSNLRQLTSELGRVWLVVGAAWFFFLRAGPLAERMASAPAAGASFLRYAWPLLFVVGVLAAAMVVTHDMGPLLVAGYGAGAFLAASVAMWWHLRSGRTVAAFMLAMGVFALWIGAVTVGLFQVGPVDAVTAARLESMAAPLASTNDQLALVTWFRRATPEGGFGLGAAPWCGWAAAGQCSGVPAQIHSDYTFTAIVGVFGAPAAWVAALGCAMWLHRLIRHHGRVTRGEPRFVAAAGTLGNDGQALLSWVAVGWVVLCLCQLAVTVAGNLAVLPLTGVTFPFVSFGMTSLVVNVAFLALTLNVDLPCRATAGEGRGGDHG
jgi:cell division protein FtsW (lipid II flippase)